MYLGSDDPMQPILGSLSKRGLTNARKVMSGGVAIVAGSMMSAAIVPATAFAQDEAEEEAIEEIVVTGSRLTVNPNLRSASPVLSVTNEEIAVRGIVNIDELTNSLPQITAQQTTAQSNGATGTSQIDLRGLGAVRTLSLIDGRRLPYGDSASTAVNIDLVPTNLVERVDVLTGGNSAVYGSDAVTGVVNFILKDDFEGAEFDIQYGFSQSSNSRGALEEVLAVNEQPIPGKTTDGDEITASLTLGANLGDGRGNVVFFGAYQNTDEILGADRVGSACTLGSGSTNGFGCVGSSNFRRFNNVADFGPTDFFQQEDGTFTPFAGGPAETFNFGASNFFQRPSERYQFYTKAHYEIAEGHEVFADVGYTQTVSDAQIAPTASFGFFARSINCGNPLIQDPVTEDGRSIAEAVLLCTPAQIAADIADPGSVVIDGLTATHRNVEGGSRNSRLENDAFRFVTGLRGTLSNVWDYEVFGQFSRTTDEDTSTNDFQIDQLGQALLVTTDADGNAVCIDPSNGCVPYNVFQRGPNGESLVTQEALGFLQGIGITTGETEQLVIGGHIQADLDEYDIRSPFAEDASVGVLLGIEYREDDLAAAPDQISQRDDGGFTGVGGATLPVQGAVDVLEVFAEVEVPLVTNKPGFQELVFNGQYRRSDYDVAGNGISNSFDTDTFGLQLTWAPVEDLTVRGQFQRAIRAPNVIELFTGQSLGLPELSEAGTTPGGQPIFDPCATTTPVATAAACANTGVTAAQFGQVPDIAAAQAGGLFGGNPLLTPETSDTFTVGVIFAPTFIEGLTVSVDYFDIEIDDAIVAGIGAQNILDNCLASGDPVFCSLINRDAAGSLNSGSVVGPGAIGFSLTNLNAASLATSGVDVQANWSGELGSAGNLNVSYAATFLSSNDFTPFLGADTIEREGRFVGQAGLPRADYRHRLFLSWLTPVQGLTASLTWRHTGEVENEGDPDSAIEGSISARNWFDLAASYEFREGIEAQVGVINLFEENFPISVSSGPAIQGNNNTFPGIYDIGRQFYFSLSAKL